MALTNKLKAIADAIRDKTGKTEELTLDEMVTEIESISVGGGFDPTVTYNIDIDIPARKTVSIYTNTSSLSDFVEHTTTTSRYGETYTPSPTNCMITTSRATAGKVSYIGLLNGMYVYLITGDSIVMLA